MRIGIVLVLAAFAAVSAAAGGPMDRLLGKWKVDAKDNTGQVWKGEFEVTKDEYGYNCQLGMHAEGVSVPKVTGAGGTCRFEAGQVTLKAGKAMFTATPSADARSLKGEWIDEGLRAAWSAVR
jgi:hypothetical protein